MSPDTIRSISSSSSSSVESVGVRVVKYEHAIGLVSLVVDELDVVHRDDTAHPSVYAHYTGLIRG